MPEFTDLGKYTTIPVSFHDVTVQVTYDPTVLTPTLWSEAEAYVTKQAKLAKQASTQAEADRHGSLALRYLLCRVVKAWDLTDGGQPYPLDIAALAKLPTQFLNRVSQAIQEAEAPKEPSGGSFDDS